MAVSSPSRQQPTDAIDRRENALGYDVVKAAPAYSAVAGLISGFALAAVVLVLTVAASAQLTHAQEIYLGFATSLFALGFIGCLLCSFSFASLGGEGNSPATMTDSMLVGSGLLISLLAVLGGFQALAQAFLPESEVVFMAVLTLTATLGPLFVWFPHWDIVQRFGPSRHKGPPRSTAEAGRLIFHVCLLGLGAAGGGVALHYSGCSATPRGGSISSLPSLALSTRARWQPSGFWFQPFRAVPG